MSALISPAYREQLNELHHSNAEFGAHGGRWRLYIDAIAQGEKYTTILDYGSGKGTLKQELPHHNVLEYDPAFPNKGLAAPCDLVVCTDVLEHVEPEKLDAVLQHLYELTRKKLFFSIATVKSSKQLPDGTNAHLIIQDADWWKKKLEKHFGIEEWWEDETECFGTALPLHQIKDIKALAAVSDEVRNQQVKQNIATCKKRVLQDNGPEKLPAHERTALLVCYGPSLNHTWPAIKLAQFDSNTDIFSVSAAHKFLLEKNIVPYAQMDCDPRPHKAIQIGEPHRNVRYWLASCVHPSYLDKLKGYDVSLWHSYNGTESLQALAWEPKQRMVMGGGSVGLRATSLLYYLGYRHIIVYGMDCSYENGEAYAGIHLGKEKPMVKVKCGERWFDTSGVFILYARYFLKQVEWCKDARFRLAGDGLLQEMFTGETA